MKHEDKEKPLFDLPKVIRSLRNGHKYTWNFAKQVYLTDRGGVAPLSAAYVKAYPNEFEKVEPEPPPTCAQAESKPSVAYSEAEALAKILADPWLEARFETGRCHGRAVAFLTEYESREKQQISAWKRIEEKRKQQRLDILLAPFGTRFTDDGRPDESPTKLPDSYERSARVGKW